MLVKIIAGIISVIGMVIVFGVLINVEKIFGTIIAVIVLVLFVAYLESN